MFLKTCDVMSKEERLLEKDDNIDVLCQLPEYVSCLRKEIIFNRNEPEAIMTVRSRMRMVHDCPVQKISVPRGVSRETNTSRRSHVNLRNKTIWDKFILRTNLAGDKAKVTNSIKMGFEIQK